MKPRVYIETSILSFYYETHNEPSAIARHDWTVEWWEKGSNYELLTSVAVLEELEQGDYDKKEKCLGLIQRIP